MRMRPLSRILRASALCAMALMMAAPSLAFEPACKSGCSSECAKGSSLLSKLPYLGRLFKNLGVAGPTEGEQAIGVDFEVCVTRDGVISIQETPITRCMFNTNACPNGKCATGVVTCAATEECSESAPCQSPLTACSAGECPLKKLEAAVSTGCCATSQACSKSCREVAKECRASATACFATAVSSGCCKSTECCAKTSTCAANACCSKGNECAVSKPTCCAAQNDCCSDAKSTCRATGESACCTVAKKCDVACNKAGACREVKTTCGSSNGCRESKTARGQGDCDHAATHVGLGTWARARQHCPLFSAGAYQGECPIAAVRLQSKIKDLETLVAVQQKVAEEKETWMGMVLEIQQQAAENQTEVLGSYMEMVVETLEARTEMMQELSKQKLEMMEQLATVHVENAKLQTKLDGAEQTLEMMHAIARLQMENEQLKQQVASVRVRGRDRNEQPVSAPAVDPRCPVTGASAPISAPYYTAPRELWPSHPMTTNSTTSYPTAIAAPTAPVIQTAANLPAETYLVRLTICEGNATTGETKKIYCDPQIVTSAGRDFECVCGGEIAAKSGSAAISVGTSVKGCVRPSSDGSVLADLKVSVRSACGDSKEIACVQELATEVSGSIKLGKELKLILGGSSSQQKWLVLTIEEAR